MGWNDICVSLVPIGRKMVAEVDPLALTSQGQPTVILHTAAEPGHPSSAHDLDACRAWLVESRFRVIQAGPAGIRMTRDEVEAFLAADGETLTEVILTFTLSHRSPDRLADWERLVAEVCPTFALSVVDRRTQQTVTISDAGRLLKSQPQWLDAAERWGWSETNDFAAARGSVM